MAGFSREQGLQHPLHHRDQDRGGYQDGRADTGPLPSRPDIADPPPHVHETGGPRSATRSAVHDHPQTRTGPWFEIHGVNASGPGRVESSTARVPGCGSCWGAIRYFAAFGAAAADRTPPCSASSAGPCGAPSATLTASRSPRGSDPQLHPRRGRLPRCGGWPMASSLLAPALRGLNSVSTNPPAGNSCAALSGNGRGAATRSSSPPDGP